MPNQIKLFPYKDPVESVKLCISYAVRISLLIAIFFAILHAQWLNTFVIALALILTFLPALIEKNYRVSLPAEFEIIMIVFIYASIYLGEIKDYYFRFSWWDSLLHSFAGILLGIFGFILLYTLNTEERIQLSLKPKFIAFFAFTFAVGVGVLWEIFEFAMDQLFGTNMQKSGINDTMADLILDTLGAMVSCLIGYFYIKKKRVPLLETMVHRFIQKNHHHFRPLKWKKKKEV